jgi:hypothetical protein
VDAVKQHTFWWSRGRIPENFSGAYYSVMDATVPHQFFAASMLAMPLVRGVLGWEPDAPNHRATLAPQMPWAWGEMTVQRLRVGETSLDVILAKRGPQFGGGAGMEVSVVADGPFVTLDLVVSVPPGARDVAVETAPYGLEETPEYTVTEGRHDRQLRISLPVDGRAGVNVSWTGGLLVENPTVDLVEGQASHGIRVVDFTGDEDGWELTVEGKAGRSYGLRVTGQPVQADQAGVTSRRAGPVTNLEITFPEGDGARGVRVIRLVPMVVPPSGRERR